MRKITAFGAGPMSTVSPTDSALAFAGDGPKRDGTHDNNYGAYQHAKCIVKGIQECNLEVAMSIVEDFHGFDPSKPDDLDTFAMPKGPSRIALVPLGN